MAGQSAATRLNGATFVDACAKLGDRADLLTAVAMHSATEAALRKLDLIDFIPDSEGKPMLRTFQGRRVVVDDNLPMRAGTTDGTVYTTYLFGRGAFAKGAAPLDERAAAGRVRDGGGGAGAGAAGERHGADQPAALHPASAGSEVHQRECGGGFADQRGAGDGRELGAGVREQERADRGGDAQ